MAIRTNAVNKTETPEAFTMAPEEETTEVATVTQAPPPSIQGGAMPSIADLADKWDQEEVGNMFPRVSGTNGGLFQDGLPFGEWMDIQVYSHAYRMFVTPVLPDKCPDSIAKDAKNFCRPSYDGKTILDRETGDRISIEEYAESISDVYPAVKKGIYHDVYCAAFATEKNSAKAVEMNILQLSVSPTSIKGFKAFVMQTKLAVLRGQMLPSHQNCVRVTAIPMSKSGINWVQMGFSAIPLDVVKGYTPIPE